MPINHTPSPSSDGELYLRNSTFRGEPSPEWKLNAATLAGLRILIVPSAEVFPDEDIATLSAWVSDGGTLIIAGECGKRLGEAANFEIVPNGSTLAPLFVKDSVVQLENDPVSISYRASEKRPSLLPDLAKTISGATAKPSLITAPEVSWKVGLTAYRAGDSIFVDINNTDLDLASDTLEPTADQSALR
jgi:hypothetical protein